MSPYDKQISIIVDQEPVALYHLQQAGRVDATKHQPDGENRLNVMRLPRLQHDLPPNKGNPAQA